MRILQQMGHHVVPLDTTPYVVRGWRPFRSLAYHANLGPPVWQLNKAIGACVNSLGSTDLIWIDRGRWIYPETLLRLKERTGATLLHYTLDTHLVFHQSRHFDVCIPLYDLVVTTKPFEIQLYRDAGARDVVLVLQGYDSRFTPVTPSVDELATYGSDVCFIGRSDQYYARRLNAVRRVAARLRIWGAGWPQYARFHPWARAHVGGEGIFGARYPRALACAKIGLGLLSKYFPETTTTRSFEIPATGVFLLAERTDDHRALFTEGVEAEFFETDDELQDKIRFYLRHDSVRAKIAAAGRERCVRSGYHSENQLWKVLEHIY